MIHVKTEKIGERKERKTSGWNHVEEDWDPRPGEVSAKVLCVCWASWRMIWSNPGKKASYDASWLTSAPPRPMPVPAQQPCSTRLVEVPFKGEWDSLPPEIKGYKKGI